MNFLFAGLEHRPNADPYDDLAGLCTMLAVEEEGIIPLEPVTSTVLRAFRKKPTDGDVQVMAARALALLLDKFTPSFSVFARQKESGTVTECYKTIFSLVSHHPQSAKASFEKTSAAQLTEEVLRCLTLGSSCPSPAVRSVMPSAAVQLMFCEASLDGSKWTSCKVLRHCALLARCGDLGEPAQQQLVKQLVYRHQQLLSELDVDYEWDELLRTVTEGIVTFRVWCAEGSSVSVGERKKAGKGKRDRDGSSARATQQVSTPKNSSADATSTTAKTTEEHYANLCLRLCGNKGIVDTRKQLVLACANSVLSAKDALLKLTASTRVLLVQLLLSLLRESSQTSVQLSNPFARKDKASSDGEDADEDGFRPLSNLQWETPSVQWSALMLLSKLLGAEPDTEKEYVWSWRGEGGIWYWYPQKERPQLTTAFFARREEVPIRDGDHRVSLLSMTDCHRATKMVVRIHFQPVPCVHNLRTPHNSERATLMESFDSVVLVKEYGASVMADTRVVLRALSFGTHALARLAKVVYLHAVCCGAPDSSEDVKSAFRNLVAEYPAVALEGLARRLVARDGGWAAVLCECGVADAIGAGSSAGSSSSSTERGKTALVLLPPALAAAAKRPRLEVPAAAAAAAAARRGSPERGASNHRRAAVDSSRTSPLVPTSATAAGGPAQRKGDSRSAGGGGESPIVKLLLETAAATTQRTSQGSRTSSVGATPTLAPLPVTLPHTTADGGLTVQLKATSFAETVAVLQALMAVERNGAPISQQQREDVGGAEEAVAWLTSDEAGKQKVTAALAALAMQLLQAVSIEGRRYDLVDTVADDVLLNIPICDPLRSSSKDGSDAAAVAVAEPELLHCPKGHALRVHFSTNWRCNKCGQHTGYGSSACRSCNYDLCHECVENMSSTLEVNPTACAGDVARVWLSRHRPDASASASTKASNGRKSTRSEANASKKTPSTADDSLYALFTADMVVPLSTPVKAMASLPHTLHCGHAFSHCLCGAAMCPPLVVSPAPALPSALSTTTTTPTSGAQSTSVISRAFVCILSACASLLAADTGVVHALVEALESQGTGLFLMGTDCLPPFLRTMLSALGPHLPLTLKVDMTKFLVVDCRRYALFHLQESGIFLRGAVQGDISSNGLAHKVAVVRGDVDGLTFRLYKAFSSLPSLRSKVEFAFEEEEGTGNGPTQELYTELCTSYRGLSAMWYASDEGGPVAFPSCTAVYFQHFFVLGAACARAFVDGYAMDIDLLPCVWPVLHARTAEVRAVALLSALEALDPAKARSYDVLRSSTDEALADMGLFDANDAPLTSATVPAYVAESVNAHFEVGLENLRAIELGLLTAVSPDDLQLLSGEELSAVLCGGRRTCGDDGELPKLFTEEELRAVTVAAHGYTADSKEVEMFLSIVGGEMDGVLQAHFLEFLTGSARLPLNGLAGLGRKITVVKKDMEDSSGKQHTLPSCSTCFLYLKLPPYTIRHIMRDRIVFAITEGRKNFSLS